MMQYDGDLLLPKHYLVSPPEIKKTSGEWLARNGVSTFACSETQKFGHVTFFWNGNRSGYFDAKLETYLEVRACWCVCVVRVVCARVLCRYVTTRKCLVRLLIETPPQTHTHTHTPPPPPPPPRTPTPERSRATRCRGSVSRSRPRSSSTQSSAQGVTHPDGVGDAEARCRTGSRKRASTFSWIDFHGIARRFALPNAKVAELVDALA